MPIPGAARPGRGCRRRRRRRARRRRWRCLDPGGGQRLPGPHRGRAQHGIHRSDVVADPVAGCRRVPVPAVGQTGGHDRAVRCPAAACRSRISVRCWPWTSPVRPALPAGGWYDGLDAAPTRVRMPVAGDADGIADHHIAAHAAWYSRAASRRSSSNWSRGVTMTPNNRDRPKIPTRFHLKPTARCDVMEIWSSRGARKAPDVSGRFLCHLMTLILLVIATQTAVLPRRVPPPARRSRQPPPVSVRCGSVICWSARPVAREPAEQQRLRRPVVTEYLPVAGRWPAAIPVAASSAATWSSWHSSAW